MEQSHIELNTEFLPKEKRMGCDVLFCYGCLALIGAGTYVLSFLAGYHLKDSEYNNRTFFDRG